MVLFNSNNKVNSIHPTFAKELDLPIKPIDVRVLKIDSIILDTYEILVAIFLVTDKANCVRFFKKNFLVANVSPKEIFGILFLTLIDINIDFLD